MKMNIFESLREDHLIQREFSGKLIKTHGDSDARERVSLAQEYRKLMSDEG